MRQVDREHIRVWIAVNEATTLPASESARFEDALQELPWTAGSSPDWAAIGAVRVDLDSPDFWQEVKRSRLGRCDYAFLIYAPDEPGIVAPIRAFFHDLDLLVSYAPGVQFFCGADKRPDGWRIFPEALGEYDGADHVTLRL